MTRLAIVAIVLTTFVLMRPASADVKFTQHDASIDVSVDGKPFTTYHFDEKTDPQFKRPYFFPVLAADGTELTSDQTKVAGGDHPHHRSFYVAHGNVNGADHWSLQLKDKQPQQRHLGFDKLENGTIVERLAWDTADLKSVLLNESRTIRFFTFEDGSRGVDLTVALMPAGKEPVTLGDTKEAGLCSVRVATAIAKSATLTNSQGKTGEKDIWGKPADWCDTSGTIDGKLYGIAIFDHPTNPRHPTQWHARQYGLMTANPFGLHDYDKSQPKGAGDMKLAPEKPTTFRYRVVFHAGDAKSAKLDEKYATFAKE